jgi:thioredoxin reductase
VEICSISSNIVAIQGEAEPLSAHSIIVATGFKPKSLPVGVHYYKEKPVKFYAVGDCTRPGRVLDAVRDGNKLAASL